MSGHNGMEEHEAEEMSDSEEDILPDFEEEMSDSEEDIQPDFEGDTTSNVR